MTFLQLLTVRGVVSPTDVHRSLTIAMSVHFPTDARIDPTAQQLIGETCTCRYASTSATGWLKRFNGVSEEMACPICCNGVTEEMAGPICCNGVTEEMAGPICCNGVTEEMACPICCNGVTEKMVIPICM